MTTRASLVVIQNLLTHVAFDLGTLNGKLEFWLRQNENRFGSGDTIDQVRRFLGVYTENLTAICYRIDDELNVVYRRWMRNAQRRYQRQRRRRRIAHIF